MSTGDTRFDALAAAARAKLGQPEAWSWCVVEVLRPTSDILVEGGIPKVGKAPACWRGVPLQRCVVTQAEQDAARAAYERTTGHCAVCSGSGQAWTGWSLNAGHHFRPCVACHATGKAQEAA
jgi:hypothetical protein